MKRLFAAAILLFLSSVVLAQALPAGVDYPPDFAQYQKKGVTLQDLCKPEGCVVIPKDIIKDMDAAQRKYGERINELEHQLAQSQFSLAHEQFITEQLEKQIEELSGNVAPEQTPELDDNTRTPDKGVNARMRKTQAEVIQHKVLAIRDVTPEPIAYLFADDSEHKCGKGEYYSLILARGDKHPVTGGCWKFLDDKWILIHETTGAWFARPISMFRQLTDADRESTE